MQYWILSDSFRFFFFLITSFNSYVKHNVWCEICYFWIKLFGCSVLACIQRSLWIPLNFGVWSMIWFLIFIHNQCNWWWNHKLSYPQSSCLKTRSPLDCLCLWSLWIILWFISLKHQSSKWFHKNRWIRWLFICNAFKIDWLDFGSSHGKSIMVKNGNEQWNSDEHGIHFRQFKTPPKIWLVFGFNAISKKQTNRDVPSNPISNFVVMKIKNRPR